MQSLIFIAYAQPILNCILQRGKLSQIVIILPHLSKSNYRRITAILNNSAGEKTCVQIYPEGPRSIGAN